MGAAFEPVVIKVGGSFRFGVFKMAEGGDLQRLLVRGDGPSSEHQLLASLKAQVAPSPQAPLTRPLLAP